MKLVVVSCVSLNILNSGIISKHSGILMNLGRVWLVRTRTGFTRTARLVGLVVPYIVTMVIHAHYEECTKFGTFFTKYALFLEYRLVGMRLLHVHQLFDPVLDRTNQTRPKGAFRLA